MNGRFGSKWGKKAEREPSDRSRFLPIGKHASSYRGACLPAYRLPSSNYYISLVCLLNSLVCAVCRRPVHITDCESCIIRARFPRTNPASTEEARVSFWATTMRETCFVARRLEFVGRGRRAAVFLVVCALSAAGCFEFSPRFCFCFFLRMHAANGMYQAALSQYRASCSSCCLKSS